MKLLQQINLLPMMTGDKDAAWQAASQKGIDGMKPFVTYFLLPLLVIIIAVFLVLTLVDAAKEYNSGNANAFKDHTTKIVVLLIIGAIIGGANLWMWIVI